MDKSTCVIKTYHPKIDKLHCWEKKPFYTTYAPYAHMKQEETRPLATPLSSTPLTQRRSTLVILVVCLLLLVLLGILMVLLLLS